MAHIPITAVGNQKGGPGKTTTALALAYGLVYKGRRVLLVDLDGQANASLVALPGLGELSAQETVYTTIVDGKPLPIYETEHPRLFVSPAHGLLAEAGDLLSVQVSEARKAGRELRAQDRLRDALASLTSVDHIVIDCPPSLGWLTVNAFTAATEIIIPVSPGLFDLDAIKQISFTIAEVRKNYNPQLRLRGLLFTMNTPTLNAANTLSLLRRLYGGLLLPVIIPRNTAVADAHFLKQDIYTFNPTSSGARAYARLVEELYP